MDKVSVVTSAYNEELGIADFLRELAKLRIPGARVEFIVVDNGSLDGTGKIIDRTLRGKKGFTILHNKPPTKGLDAGLLAGFAKARGNYIAIIRSDWQEDPADIAKLYGKMVAEGLDCIVGWRKDRKDPFDRLFYSRLYNIFCRMIYGIPVPDINGAPKIFKAGWVKGYELESKRFIIDLEQLWHVKKGGGRIGYCEATHFARRKGKPTVSMPDFIRMGLDFLEFTVRHRFSD